MRLPLLWGALIVGAVNLTFCGPDGARLAAGPAGAAAQIVSGFSTLTSPELASSLAHKNFYLVNAHVPYEGEIEGTDAFIPFDRIADNLDKLPADKNAKIVLYCRSGRMSEIAARELVKLGYRNVSHLSGGTIAWEKSGQRVIRRPAP
jgi:rhodanese-related sulfurtransferase